MNSNSLNDKKDKTKRELGRTFFFTSKFIDMTNQTIVLKFLSTNQIIDRLNLHFFLITSRSPLILFNDLLYMYIIFKIENQKKEHQKIQ